MIENKYFLLAVILFSKTNAQKNSGKTNEVTSVPSVPSMVKASNFPDMVNVARR